MLPIRQKGDKVILYTPEEKDFFVKCCVANLRDNGVPNWADSVRQINKERPGLLRGKTEDSQKTYLTIMWKKNNPMKGMEREAKRALENINKEIDRKSLIEILKVKGKQFLLTEFDTLKPAYKAWMLSEVIKIDANEEKIAIERMKLDKNNSMMDNIAQALMSSDKKAILSKYQIELTSTDEHASVIEGNSEYEITTIQ